MELIKKLISIISLFICSYNSAQNFNIAAAKNNVVYIGVDNPLYVYAGSYRSDEITVKPTKGKITGGYGMYYNYQCAEPGPFSVIVYNKRTSQEIGRSTFRAKYIPSPTAKVGKYSSGDIKEDMIKIQRELKAELADFDFDVIFIVDSFTINIIRPQEQFFKKETNIGGKFSDAVRNALNLIKEKDVVIFKEIYVTGPDGGSMLLPPVVFTVTAKLKLSPLFRKSFARPHFLSAFTILTLQYELRPYRASSGKFCRQFPCVDLPKQPLIFYQRSFGDGRHAE